MNDRLAGGEQPPALPGVEHRFVDVGAGVSLHVADAGPADGPPVMLVHGFPQNWLEWRALIAPLADDGHRVLCPDLRGAGWSSAPRTSYEKSELADDLATALDRLAVGPVKLVAHDWGGPVAIIMALRHPAKVTGFFGLNTAAPWVSRDPDALRNVWRYWYQLPIAAPILGPRLLADRKGRFLRMLDRWVGGGFALPDDDFAGYLERMRAPGHAVAGSRWYRSFLTREMIRWLRGEFAGSRLDVPVRWLHGAADPVLTADMIAGYAGHAADFDAEVVDGVGHWIVEQRPDLVLDRLRSFLR